MSAADPPSVTAEKLLYLTELIAAIDRRIPHVERAGEAAVAEAAVRLRLQAEQRIVEIQQAEIQQMVAGRQSPDRRPA